LPAAQECRSNNISLQEFPGLSLFYHSNIPWWWNLNKTEEKGRLFGARSRNKSGTDHSDRSGYQMPNLTAVIDSALVYQKANPLDSYLAVTDSEGEILLFLQPETFKMGVKVGDKVASTGANAECIQTQKEVAKILPQELYGLVVKVISVPVFDGDQFVGVITTGTSFDRQQKLQQAAENIATTSGQITATVEEIAATATQLAGDLVSIRSGGGRVLDEIQKTDDILQFVSDVAENSNLLGLNAAIEAARAGDHGRGFAVVADEIRKMAVNSEQAVKDIKRILGNIQQENTAMVKTILQAAQVSENQAAATEEISASMQQFATLAASLEKIAEII
jgi:hypothetical protein